MTRNELNNKINFIINSIDPSEKDKEFSWKHLINDFILVEYDKSYDKSYKLKFCKECNKFTCHFGKCRVCQSKKYGLGNPEIHQKTIDAQIKNGTFNMLNKEIQRNKVSNINIKYKHEKLYCDKCKEITFHRIWNDNKIRCCKCDFKNNGYNKSFCKKCNNITIHNGKFCCICNKNSISGCLPNFITKDNVLYFYDRNIQDYIPWEDYKKKFIIQSNEYTDINKILSLLPGFKLYPTFRTQDSDFWSDGSKSAFEQSLVDDNIMWFTYIKFYISHNNSKIEEIASIRPLVVGKSGSLLVNNSGSDLSFSTDINDGPARRFLAESNNNSSWDKTKIAILPCENESEAFEKENYYLQKLNIFSS